MFLWAIPLSKKGYRCYNPITRELRVSKDVVFDEMSSWYNDVNDGVGAEIKEQVVAQKIMVSNHRL